MWANKKISGSENGSTKEIEDRLQKPSERGTAVRKTRKRGGRQARR